MASEPPHRRQDRTVRLESSEVLLGEAADAIRAQRRPVLVVVSGHEVGRRFALEGNPLAGRDPDTAIPLNDRSASWHHARFEDRGDGWAVVDLGSTNGTRVNGQRLPEAVLQVNDKVTVGNTVLRFEEQDAADQAFGEALEKLLHIDELSGLYVRRRFDAELAVLLQQAMTDGTPVGMLVMDLDGVKGINDAHGHLFGAHVIGESGRVIGKVLDGRGIAARFGGDEYVAAVAGLSVDEAADLGEQIRSAIADHPFTYRGVSLRPGISIGVAAAPESGKDVQSLFEAADQALYRAKAGGKNRVSR